MCYLCSEIEFCIISVDRSRRLGGRFVLFYLNLQRFCRIIGIQPQPTNQTYLIRQGYSRVYVYGLVTVGYILPRAKCRIIEICALTNGIKLAAEVEKHASTYDKEKYQPISTLTPHFEVIDKGVNWCRISARHV